MKNVTVVGAGTMGNGIAHVFALNDFKVSLFDLNPKQLENAKQTISKNLDRQVAKGLCTADQKERCLANIYLESNLKDPVSQAELIVEAATENIELKLKIFSELDGFASANCILATNTSSISITKIASATKRPQKVIGMHFMNPVPVMKLVEIINGFHGKSSYRKNY